MTASDFRFDLGRMSLNFVATVGGRLSGEPVDRIPTPAHLTEWIRLSGLFGEEASLPDLDERDLAEAIKLRESIHGLIHDVVHGHPPSKADLRMVNKAAAAAAPPAPQLVLDAAGSQWKVKAVNDVTLEQMLSMIARDAIELLGGVDGELLRECEGKTCDGIYVDRSRGFRRRWCSSRTCGNQVRVERFRAKAAS